MIKRLGIAAVAALTASAAQASIITFSGGIAPEGDADVSFSGRVNDAAGTGSVTVKYFFNNPTSPGPIIGTDTITGTGSFFRATEEFPPGGVELDIKVANATSTFELEGTENALTVGFSDPARGLNFVDRVDPSSLSITVSNVPLPATAPMFGAGLLGLGILGCGLKRRRRPQGA